MTAPRDMAAEARSVRIESEIARRGIKLSAGTVEHCGPCPVCGGTDRFSINLKKQVWNCRRCERGGEVIALVCHLDGLSFGEGVRLLTGHAPPSIPAAGGHHGATGHIGVASRPPRPSPSRTTTGPPWPIGVRAAIRGERSRRFT
jgi:CHC2 zinc finger